MQGWIVTIYSMNDKGTIDEFSTAEYGSLYNCTRIIHTFKAKRGYQVIKYEIERGNWLV